MQSNLFPTVINTKAGAMAGPEVGVGGGGRRGGGGREGRGRRGSR